MRIYLALPSSHNNRRIKLSKHIKKIIISAVTAFLLCSPAAAIYNKGLSASAIDTVYTIFPDINATDWFAADVKKLTDAGLISGYPDGYFHPDREMTVAEFLKIISPQGKLQLTGNVQLYPEHWASEYLTYAYENDIITDQDLISGFDPDELIDRFTMIKMMVTALNIKPAEVENPFTDTTDKYAITAYNEYLLRGYIQPNGSRLFSGEQIATRSEAVTIAIRVIEYREDSYEFKKNAVLENAKNNILRTEHEIIDLFHVLNREFMTEFTFQTSQTTRFLREYCERSNVLNLEYFYNAFTNITPLGNGNYKITIEYLPDIDTVKNYHKEAVKAADKIISENITSEMTDAEKVRVLHNYLVANCEYDIVNYNKGTITQESRLAYGALINKKAVCQGYCAAFSLLCGRAGVSCIVVGGNAPNSHDSHAWNVVLIDGKRYHVDTTHDDPVPDQKGIISDKYFCLTEDEMISYGYTWDKKSSALKYLYY